MPQIAFFNSITDPTEHLENYGSLMAHQIASDAILCKSFSLMLTGPARVWHRKLRSGSIGSFRELERLFTSQFLGSIPKKKDWTHLFSIRQGKDESLEAFVSRFSQALILVDGCNEDTIVTVAREGLHNRKLL